LICLPLDFTPNFAMPLSKPPTLLPPLPPPVSETVAV
jgi:hypothetical protein